MPVEDLLDLGQEAHVGHAVGLVEHEHLDRRRATARRARCRSMRRPGVPTTTSTPLLQRRRSAAPSRRRRRRRGTLRSRASPSGASTSLTWLASSRVGHEDEAVRAARARPCRRARGAGRPKARVLPEPVLALPQHVAPGEGVGDGERLDRERLGDALAGQGRDEVGEQAEAREGCGHGDVARFRRVGTEVPADVRLTLAPVAVGRTSVPRRMRVSDDGRTREASTRDAGRVLLAGTSLPRFGRCPERSLSASAARRRSPDRHNSGDAGPGGRGRGTARRGGRRRPHRRGLRRRRRPRRARRPLAGPGGLVRRHRPRHPPARA